MELELGGDVVFTLVADTLVLGSMLDTLKIVGTLDPSLFDVDEEVTPWIPFLLFLFLC